MDNIYLYDQGTIFGAIASDGVAYWYCTDVRGSVTKIMKGNTNTSLTTTLDTSYVYNAYGETDTTIAGTSTFRNDIAYTGAIIDHESGLYYLMSRYYDPALAQFISEDSYRGDGEAFWHLYAYCNGDPVNFIDRDGQKRLTKSYTTRYRLWTAPVANTAQATISVEYEYVGMEKITTYRTENKIRKKCISFRDNWKIYTVTAVVNAGTNWSINGFDLEYLVIDYIIAGSTTYYRSSFKTPSLIYQKGSKVASAYVSVNKIFRQNSVKCSFHCRSKAYLAGGMLFNGYIGKTVSVTIM